jgi:hypothetical protein
MDNDLIIYWLYTLGDIPQESRWHGFDSDLQTLHEYAENFEDVKIRISELELDAKVALKLTVPQKHYQFDYASILTLESVLHNLIFTKHEDQLKTYFKRDQYFDKSDGYLLKQSSIQFKLLTYISPTPIQRGIIAGLRETYSMDDTFIDQIYLGKDDALAAVAEMLTNSTNISLLGAWYKLAQTPPGMPSSKDEGAFVKAVDLLIKQARPKPLRSHAKAIVEKIQPLIGVVSEKGENSIADPFKDLILRVFKTSVKSWHDVTIEFISNDQIRISITGAGSKQFLYNELGFEDGRNKINKVAMWDELDKIAIAGGNTGKIPFNERSIKEKQFANLRKHFRNLFSLQDDPFPYQKGKMSYETAFTIIPNQNLYSE